MKKLRKTSGGQSVLWEKLEQGEGIWSASNGDAEAWGLHSELSGKEIKFSVLLL